MTTTSYEERLRGELQKAKERGGLPDLAELEDVLGVWSDLANAVDQAAQDAATVAAAYGDAVEIPFTITTEHIAALSLFVHHSRDEIESLKSSLNRIERNITGVDLARRKHADDA